MDFVQKKVSQAFGVRDVPPMLPLGTLLRRVRVMGYVAYPFPKQEAGQVGRQGWAMDDHQGWGLTFSTSPVPTCLALPVPLQLHGPSL